MQINGAFIARTKPRSQSALAERILAHPHLNEQPFTRSTPFAALGGISEVTIVAGCTDGDLSQAFVLSLAPE